MKLHFVTSIILRKVEQLFLCLIGYFNFFSLWIIDSCPLGYLYYGFAGVLFELLIPIIVTCCTVFSLNTITHLLLLLSVFYNTRI